MTSIGYYRLSTLEQAQNSHALEQQCQRLRSAGVNELIGDIESGSSSKRPQFNALISRIKAGEISEVVATRIDRLHRRLVKLKEFADLCLEHGVNLRVLDQSIDLSTPHGKLMFNVLGSVAEWEVDLLKSRVNHGMKHLRQEKRAPSIVPFGYVRSEEGKYNPDLSEYRDGKTRWEVAREIIDTFLTIGTVRGTVREMERIYGTRNPNFPKWHQGEFPRVEGLKYWLCNPVLRGDTGYFYRQRNKDTEPVLDTHEALISRQEWREIERHLTVKERKKRSPDMETLPLAGLVYCGKCGGKCKAYKHTKTLKSGEVRIVSRWYCFKKHDATPTCEGSKGVRNDVLENMAIEELTNRADLIADIVHADEPIAYPLTREMKDLTESLMAIESLPSNLHLEEAKEKIRTQIEILKREQVDNQEADRTLRDELIQIGVNPEFWRYLKQTGDLKRMFRRFVDRIVIADDRIEVRLRV